MILLLASSLYDDDPQITTLEKSLKSRGGKYYRLNPLNPQEWRNMRLELSEGQRPKLLVGDTDITPSHIMLSRNLRVDCIIDVPTECNYPTLYRSKIQSFINDILICFRDSTWFPGTRCNVDVGECKPYVYDIAYQLGLKIPSVSVNAFEQENKQLPEYRKILGPPFTITYDSSQGKEVAVTLINNRNNCTGVGGIPWQWQYKINPQLHIRCAISREKVWSFSVPESILAGRSLREAQETDGISWKSHTLPRNVVKATQNLLRHLGLKFACPEFLVDKSGKYVFIDLNPCGDWYGFGDEEISISIADHIVSML